MPFYLQWALDAVMKFIAGYITPDLIKGIEASAIAYMRQLAKDKTPNFPFDDELVELIAKALGVA